MYFDCFYLSTFQYNFSVGNPPESNHSIALRFFRATPSPQLRDWKIVFFPQKRNHSKSLDRFTRRRHDPIQRLRDDTHTYGACNANYLMRSDTKGVSAIEILRATADAAAGTTADDESSGRARE